ncbi:MAG: TIGR00725 family protein [Candidatus Firestonebacteria bacterium]|nr:TIGR00725 family protein [Candidatus Firestonebacteria bacterium]
MQIGVIGASSCSTLVSNIAEKVGEYIAKHKAVLVCGGMGGIMEAACRGAKKTGGITIGILPTDNIHGSNPYVDIKIPTDMGHARNIIVVHSSDAIIAISGGFGTLSEIAIALKLNIPVIGLGTWEHPSFNIHKLDDPEKAVKKALELAEKKRSVFNK